jgi:hypothetical protein
MLMRSAAISGVTITWDMHAAGGVYDETDYQGDGGYA